MKTYVSVIYVEKIMNIYLINSSTGSTDLVMSDPQVRQEDCFLVDQVLATSVTLILIEKMST